MRADQWEATWAALKALFPKGQFDELLKVQWAAALDACEPAWLVEAARAHARSSEWPSLAGLTSEYATVSAQHQERQRLERLAIGTALPERFFGPEKYDEAYEAMDPAWREALEVRLKTRYSSAYAGRESDPNLRWAWHCLVVAADQRGIDEDGSVTGLPKPEGDARWEGNLEATRRQMIHEAGCAKCRGYAEPPGSPSKANATRERQGAPCPVGAIYWQPHWAAGMPRPSA